MRLKSRRGKALHGEEAMVRNGIKGNWGQNVGVPIYQTQAMRASVSVEVGRWMQ